MLSRLAQPLGGGMAGSSVRWCAGTGAADATMCCVVGCTLGAAWCPWPGHVMHAAWCACVLAPSRAVRRAAPLATQWCHWAAGNAARSEHFAERGQRRPGSAARMGCACLLSAAAGSWQAMPAGAGQVDASRRAARECAGQRRGPLWFCFLHIPQAPCVLHIAS